MDKLTYKELYGSKDMLIIDLHNSYSIIAIKIWNAEQNNYTVMLMLKENTVDRWSLIEDIEPLEFNTNYKFINSAILKKVSELNNEEFFNYYIQRYEYELECFDKGNEFFEKERNKNV